MVAAPRAAPKVCSFNGRRRRLSAYVVLCFTKKKVLIHRYYSSIVVSVIEILPLIFCIINYMCTKQLNNFVTL